MIADIAWYGSVLVATLYALFLSLCFVKFLLFRSAAAKSEFTGTVTVVIAARNEEQNIRPLLESLDKQECSFPFEVLVVDDASEDKTVQVAQSYWPKKFRLQVLSNQGAGKKDALTTGVHHAQSEIILVTDADCVADPQWVQRMAEQFTDEQACFVAGMVRPSARDNLIGPALSTEMVFLQVVSAGLFALGNPLLCNGASMGFRRKFFLDVQGFAHDQFVSGDDIMLLQKARYYAPMSIRWLKNSEAMVETEVAGDFNEAMIQRHRWLSKMKVMSDPVSNVAGILFFANQLLIPAALGGIILFGIWDNPFWMALGIKTGVELLLLSLAASFFRETNAIVMLPVSAVVYCIISIGAVFRWLSGDVQWKGRNWRKGRVR